MNNLNFYQEISKIIYLKRMELGYTQSYMAGLLNISQNVYSINERKIQEVSVSRFLKILDILDLSVDDVIKHK